MGKVIITSQKLVDLADAVRTHNSISDKLKLPDIPGMLNVGLAPGTYDASGNLLKSWDQLIADGDVSVRDGNGSNFNELVTPNDRVTRFTNVDSIVIDSSVMRIGELAFFKCAGLKSITIPDSVTSIGKSSIVLCTGLTEITIPDSVTYIGENVFAGCTNLTKIYYKGTAEGAPWYAENATVITDF